MQGTVARSTAWAGRSPFCRCEAVTAPPPRRMVRRSWRTQIHSRRGRCETGSHPWVSQSGYSLLELTLVLGLAGLLWRWSGMTIHLTPQAMPAEPSTDVAVVLQSHHRWREWPGYGELPEPAFPEQPESGAVMKPLSLYRSEPGDVPTMVPKNQGLTSQSVPLPWFLP